MNVDATHRIVFCFYPFLHSLSWAIAFLGK